MVDSEPNRHHNTFLFLRYTLYQTHGTYSITEITNRLENSLPDIRTSQCRKAGVTVKKNNSKRQDRLVGADFLEKV